MADIKKEMSDLDLEKMDARDPLLQLFDDPNISIDEFFERAGIEPPPVELLS